MANCRCVDEVRDSRNMKAGVEKITLCENHKCHSKTLRKEQMLKQDENALKISTSRKHLCCLSGENIQHAIVPCQSKDQQTY